MESLLLLLLMPMTVAVGGGRVVVMVAASPLAKTGLSRLASGAATFRPFIESVFVPILYRAAGF